MLRSMGPTTRSRMNCAAAVRLSIAGTDLSAACSTNR
jgi:hypothetical protein